MNDIFILDINYLNHIRCQVHMATFYIFFQRNFMIMHGQIQNFSTNMSKHSCILNNIILKSNSSHVLFNCIVCAYCVLIAVYYFISLPRMEYHGNGKYHFLNLDEFILDSFFLLTTSTPTTTSLHFLNDI